MGLNLLKPILGIIECLKTLALPYYREKRTFSSKVFNFREKPPREGEY